MVTAYRITQTRFLDSAFSGEGAYQNGGRWNFKGTSMVYLASSISLATLEILVHVEDLKFMKDRYSVIPVRFDAKYVKEIEKPDLPEGWNAPVTSEATRKMGNAWIEKRESLVLRVPSAVTPDESNYLLNPSHPAMKQLKIAEPSPLTFDPRLIR